jgi:hypothetical protein
VMQGTERLLVLRAGCWMNLKLRVKFNNTLNT